MSTTRNETGILNRREEYIPQLKQEVGTPPATPQPFGEQGDPNIKTNITIFLLKVTDPLNERNAQVKHNLKLAEMNKYVMYKQNHQDIIRNKSKLTFKMYGMDMDENTTKENIDGVGLHTL